MTREPEQMIDDIRFDHNEWGEVITGITTIAALYTLLKYKGSAFIGWTDEAGSHYDILFTLRPTTFGANIQGGLRPQHDLIVSIMRVGSFGFHIDGIKGPPMAPSYIGEKLFLNGKEAREKLADIINYLVAVL